MHNRDLTHGSIWRLLLSFALPLFLGNFLQQLYSAFDAIVVGNWVGEGALAAVGTVGPLINMIISFFVGVSTGAGVLISQSYGAQDVRSVQDTVHTAVVLSLVIGVLLSVAGVFVSPIVLGWMNTPEEVFSNATVYLRVYCSGIAALTVYNMGAAILTAVGDARRPLYFLLVSTVIKISGSLFFVAKVRLGIAGVGLTTVIAQVVAATLVLTVLVRSQTEYRLDLRRLRITWPIVGRIARIGLPGGLQQAIVSMSNIMVQSYINGLGKVIVAGYSAEARIEGFVALPSATMALAAATFVGQNLGARKVERARRGAGYSLILSALFTVPLSVLTVLFGRNLIGLFTPDAAVIESGFVFMRIFIPMYFLICVTNTIPGALRGAGDVRVPTLACIGSFVVLRQIYLFFVTRVVYTQLSVGIVYPITWSVAGIILILYYRRTNWNSFAAAPAPDPRPDDEATPAPAPPDNT